MSDLDLDLADLLGADLAAFVDSLPERSAYERECDDCGGAFAPRQPWGRFCSGRCRLRAWRQEQAKG